MKTRAVWWGGAFLVAMAAHIALLTGWREESVGPGQGAELEVVLLMSAIRPVEEPAIEQPEPEPEPEPELEPEPVVEPEPVPLPQPEPVEVPPVQQVAMSSRPAIADRPATSARPKAAASASLSQPSGAEGQASYAAILQAWFEKHKSYPYRARSRRQQGVVKVAFRIDRDGVILDPRIVSGSGHRLLDRATLELMQRASPAPKPTDDVPGEQISFEIPIVYSLR